MTTELFIDGKNIAYRAAFVSTKSREKYNGFMLMAKFISSIIQKFKPDNIHVFWDCKRDNIWRKQIYEPYKIRLQNNNLLNVGPALEKTITTAKLLLPHLGVKQYFKDKMEADDLIFAACKVFNPNKIIIASTDSDYSQIIYYNNNIVLYDHKKNEIISVPDVNPIIQKALSGEKGDNISGYHGIGPVTSKKIAADPKLLHEFLQSNDKSIFYRNLLLVDLSLCPHLLKNQVYIMNESVHDKQFSKDEIMKIVAEHKIKGAYQEFENVLLPFKFVGSVINESKQD